MKKVAAPIVAAKPSKKSEPEPAAKVSAPIDKKSKDIKKAKK